MGTAAGIRLYSIEFLSVERWIVVKPVHILFVAALLFMPVRVFGAAEADEALRHLADTCASLWHDDAIRKMNAEEEHRKSLLYATGADYTAWLKRNRKIVKAEDVSHDAALATYYAYLFLGDNANRKEGAAFVRIGEAVARAREALVASGLTENAARLVTAVVLLRMSDCLAEGDTSSVVPRTWPLMLSALSEDEREGFGIRAAEAARGGHPYDLDRRSAAAYMYEQGRRVPMKLPDDTIY